MLGQHLLRWFIRAINSPPTMALFSRKAPEPEPPPDPVELGRVRAEILLNTDAAFRILTVDSLAWLCPYTGAKVPAPFGHFEVAREYLAEKRPWVRFKPKAAEDLNKWRWVLHLRDNIDEEPRLSMFGKDGRWLNPYTGKWVVLPPQARTPQQRQEICARVLAVCKEAQSGRLLPLVQLEALHGGKAAAERERSAFSVDALDPLTQTGATQRISGSRATEVDLRPADSATTGHSDLLRAKAIIEKMLPEPPAVPGYGVMVHYEPHGQVGGDFFDFLPLADGSTLAVLGDVAGHGVQGALVVVAALKALRFLSQRHEDVSALLTAWNDDVRRDLLPGQFITVFAVRFHPETHKATLYCCGHQPALLCSPTRKEVLQLVGQIGPAIGLMSSAIFSKALRPVSLDLLPGDVLVNYTDGLNEAHDRHGREFGQFRVYGQLISHLDQPYDHLVKLTVGEVKAFADDKLEDDLTVICLTREGGPREEE